MLIADPDRVSERAIEVALDPEGYLVEWARGGEAALDIMRRTRVDLVISDSQFDDMPGLTLLRRTAELFGPGAPTFLVASADRGAPTKVALLRAGAADYVAKPFAAEELRARVHNLLQARRRERAAQVRGVTGLAGDAAVVPLPDILSMLELGQQSGVLHVAVGATSGQVVLERGRLRHAEVGNVSGPDAFFVLVEYNAGVYRFAPGEVKGPSTLGGRVSEMLLQAAVREDHARDGAAVLGAAATTSARLREIGVVKASIDMRGRAKLEARPPRGEDATARLAIALADPMTLGELLLAPDVRPAPAGTLQLRVELWASGEDGLPSLLELASPPGFEAVAAALGDEPLRAHLRFESEVATLVVTLVDLERAGAPPAGMPHALIVAPTRGELVTIAPPQLAELTRRLGASTRPVVAAFGGAALASTIGRLVDDPARVRTGARLDDLRATLGDVVRRWSAPR